MSVINKMLRDLDSRQTGGPAPFSTPAQGVGARTGAARHTLSVKSTEPPGRQAPSLARALQLVTMVLTVGGVAAWWYLNQSAAPQLAAAPTGQVAITERPPVAPVVPSSAPLATSSVTVASPAVRTVPVSASPPAPSARPTTLLAMLFIMMVEMTSCAPKRPFKIAGTRAHAAPAAIAAASAR